MAQPEQDEQDRRAQRKAERRAAAAAQAASAAEPQTEDVEETKEQRKERRRALREAAAGEVVCVTPAPEETKEERRERRQRLREVEAAAEEASARRASRKLALAESLAAEAPGSPNEEAPSPAASRPAKRPATAKASAGAAVKKEDKKPSSVLPQTAQEHTCGGEGVATPSAGSKPKRPSSSYFQYSTAVRSEVAAEMGNNSTGPVSKEIGRRWKEMSQADRVKWEDLAQIAKAKYAEDLAQYIAANPDAASPPAKRSKVKQEPVDSPVKTMAPKVELAVADCAGKPAKALAAKFDDPAALRWLQKAPIDVLLSEIRRRVA